METKVKILVVDDDPKVPWIISEGLGERFEIESVRDGQEALSLLSKKTPSTQPDLVLLDIKMPGLNGLDILERIKKLDTGLDVMMLSGHGDTKNIVESIKRGATEFINKPFDVKELEIHIRTVLEKKKLKEEISNLKKKLRETAHETLIGDSESMLRVKNVVEQVAPSELTVLIRGESGTGKEIIARMIHNLSPRKAEPFVKVNCAAIPRELLEAELFGYEKGAFTGANKTKPGRFEVANKGTMFLDEIGDMPIDLQTKLLQVLEHQEFVRVGGINNIHVDVRIVCATNRNLEEAMQKGLMRDDLYYRLNEITIQLPPLRDRKEDIPLIVNHYLEKYSLLYNKDYRSIRPETMKHLCNYYWPGNVRQLENLTKQIVVRGDEQIIYETLKGPIPAPAAGQMALPVNLDDDNFTLKAKVDKVVAEVEKNLITRCLTKTNWNRRKAAKLLDISYRSLLYKIKEYKIID
ncbi:MAG: sigma-54-dependent Fis family transcriptional regulator [candidate division Zixibacteria bacterium]|jgi:DNA-binding NtrC family response regulator|nr:sigma-54-dependent Fis family transcriptional regulator [candidate division Zixibacteria bacterium]